MTNSEIAARLSLIAAVRTPRQAVWNDIVRVGTDHVVMRSARTGTDRTIPFADIREPAKVTRNGIIVYTLASILGFSAPSAAEGPAPASLDEEMIKEPLQAFIRFYLQAKRWAQENTDWDFKPMAERDPAAVTAASFLADYSWALYVSGLRATTVKAKWPLLQSAWANFDPARITDASAAEARKAINHVNKTSAIRRVAAQIATAADWALFRKKYLRDVQSLTCLAWMGPANSRFLARNLGIADVGKPDRWIVGLAARFDFETVEAMFDAIHKAVGDSPGDSDLYLWAYLAENGLPVAE